MLGLEISFPYIWRFVPRTKSQEVALRNEAMVDMCGSRSRREVAEHFGVSQAYVSQVVLKHQEETSVDESRAYQDVRYERVLETQFEILRAPLQVKVSASGKPVYLPDPDDPSGRTPDYSKPVYDYAPRNEAAKVIIAALAGQSKLNALDTVRVKQVDETDAIIESRKYTQQILDERALYMKQVAELTAKYEVIPSGEPAESAD